ncbi:MAG: bifunctional (p)ppGpp synthetase/guanosine-3',5'-bis(diphosphate) 3'-pyrophosphohydrolase [Chloroflexi bacterium]|nr:bifunctional (p)ppGpp synthetase/guanosine-3',5'-bis(diphosphate) 3'-pyrophosphohydrolase [Chloroflexota bacterium]
MSPHPLIDSALAFAARAHDGQVRKSTDVPYIVHPVGVMMVLIECGETDSELLAAALLHDTVEDTGVTLAELRERFGTRIAFIVEGCSEPNKNDTWEHRKQHTVAHLRTAPRDVALVSAADKLHNVRSMAADYSAMGERVWSRFKRGKPEIAWYYRSVTESLKASELREHEVVKKLDEAVKGLFAPAGKPAEKK